ncbi:SDR family NAD(P)-dependent oxidoreductase, partial [Streptomyces cavernae]|uniref:SDR family NAD(P)-dependent oxidoreductase n=1 Tax=Streptomyces cavernae TaxID=2259034 RepID=UPI000FEB87A4
GLLGEGVALAAVNGPAAVVLSGEEGPVTRAVDVLRERGVRVRQLRVSHAFHSPLMTPMLDRFRTVVEAAGFHQPRIPLRPAGGGRTDMTNPDYWVAQVTGTVRFADALTHEIGSWLEIGPAPVLTALADDTGVPAVRGPQSETGDILNAVARVWLRGHDVDWTAVLPGRRRVDLPTYAFQHQDYWLTPAPQRGDFSAAGLTSTAHPVLLTSVGAAGGDQTIFSGRLSLAAHPWLDDHRVLGSVLFPGTGFADLAVTAGRALGCPRLTELTLGAPLVLTGDTGHFVQVVVGAPDDTGARPVTLYSRSEDQDDWNLHGSGTLDAATALEWRPDVWPPTGAEPVALDGFYDGLVDAGFDYGPAFRGLTSAWRRDGEVFAEITLPGSVQVDGFAAHPGLLDSALHAMALLWDGPQHTPRIPFSWQDVSLTAEEPWSLRIRLSRNESGAVVLDAADAAGQPAARIGKLVLREVDADKLHGPDDVLADSRFRVEWTGLDPAAPTRALGTCAVLDADRTGLAATAGEHAPTGAPAPVSEHAGVAALVAALVDGAPVPDTVVARCPRTGGDDLAAAHHAAAWALELVQTWLAEARLASSRLVVVIDGGVAQSTVTGLVRTAQTEHPGRITLVHEETGPAPAAALTTDEPEVTVREGQLLKRRLVPAEPLLDVPAAGPWRLDFPVRGSLADLAVVPAPEADRPLEAGEVRLHVRAAGVNFRDVLIGLDVYPGDARPGIEAAGVVVETGPGTGLREGDRVMGLVPDAFGPTVVADARTLVRIPDGWSFTTAAAVPVAFLTAYYGLVDLAGLAAGQRVLVHAAAGGVGTAAVQLARHLGAEVFGTAGPAKHDRLRAAGLDDTHIASSRTVEFENTVLQATGGRGVDVVLNSLADEFTDASLRATAPGGRFVDIGKTDLRAPETVAAEHPGVTYRHFDLSDAGPERIAGILTELVRLFEAGELSPPEITVWDVRSAREALRTVSQAALTGKAVLTVGPRFEAGETVLVTGGTGTLGRQVARHLVLRHGVRHITLVGRSHRPEADAVTAELVAAGAQVDVRACDIGDENAVRELLAAATTGRRLAGVVHAAGTVADGVVTSLDTDALTAVLRPKADGAWHLHRLTQGLDLRLFAVFSSASATFGSAGQANYAAANTFLDALAEHRRAHRMPATALAWGLWAESSTMTEGLSAVDLRRMNRSGVLPLGAEQGLALFDAGTGSTQPALVAARLDLSALRRTHRDHPAPALLRTLVPPARTAAGRPEPDTTGAARLAGLARPEQLRAVLDLVRAQAAAVLGHGSADDVDAGQAFKEMGFDSLTAVELRNRLKAATGAALPATAVFDHPSPLALAEHVVGLLAPAELGAAEAVLRELDGLEPVLETVSATDGAHAEIVDRLSRMLSRLRDGGAPAAEALDDASLDEVLAFIDTEFSDLDQDGADRRG